MSDPHGQSHIFDSDEADRLARQAALAIVETHLRRLRIPPHARVLDACCGAGAMSRALASHQPDASVVGLDLRADQVARAAGLAKRQGLANLTFRAGDVQDMPFADANFELLWCGDALQAVPRPDVAIAECRRVLAPGGVAMFALPCWPGYMLDPPNEELQQRVQAVMSGLIDAALPARLPRAMMQAGFADISVQMDQDRLHTVIGAIDRERRATILAAAAATLPYLTHIIGGEALVDAFLVEWFAWLDRPDTVSVLPLWFVQGSVPAP